MDGSYGMQTVLEYVLRGFDEKRREMLLEGTVKMWVFSCGRGEDEKNRPICRINQQLPFPSLYSRQTGQMKVWEGAVDGGIT